MDLSSSVGLPREFLEDGRMQIDMHHSLIYVLARLAGFDDAQSQVIAYSSQYVDDATGEGTIRFDNKARFDRISSAHKMLNYRNLSALARHRSWIPFHFLPGNELCPSWDGLVPEYVQRLVCRPNSAPAQQMVARCIEDQDSPHALYRLGITLHTYADTWSHQGFAGIDHEVNRVQDILDWHGASSVEMNRYVASFYGRSPFERLKDRIVALFAEHRSPVGHGAVLGFPDRPYLRWKYRNFNGEVVARDNPSDYLDAADHMYSVLCMFRQQSFDSDGWQCVPEPDRQVIQTLIEDVHLPDGRERHYSWLRAIADSRFSFGAAEIHYQAKGRGSWKHAALGSTAVVDRGDEVYSFDPRFLESHWKLFHDALQQHRTVVLQEIMPSVQLCAA